MKKNHRRPLSKALFTHLFFLLLILICAEGMKFELDHAKETRKPVRLYDTDFNPVNVKTIPVDERADARYKGIIRNLKVLK